MAQRDGEASQTPHPWTLPLGLWASCSWGTQSPGLLKVPPRWPERKEGGTGRTGSDFTSSLVGLHPELLGKDSEAEAL